MCDIDDTKFELRSQILSFSHEIYNKWNREIFARYEIFF